MLSIYLGPDDFTKRQELAELAKKGSLEVQTFRGPQELPNAQVFLEQNLFSKPKLFILEDVQPAVLDSALGKIAQSPNHVVLCAPSVDKRVKVNKEILDNKAVTVKEFLLPHGKELDQWLIARARKAGATLSPKAADALARALGRDSCKETKFGGKVVSVEEAFTLWQAESELQKLLAYADGGEITPDAVQALVETGVQADALEITNAIADSDKLKTIQLIQRFLKDNTSADEKGGIIQLNALLSEQFRNVAMIQDFVQRRVPEEEILAKTGWKSGRVFVMKKIAGRFPAARVIDALNKLEHLDEELKTSQTPPRVLLDLILVQLMA